MPVLAFGYSLPECLISYTMKIGSTTKVYKIPHGKDNTFLPSISAL